MPPGQFIECMRDSKRIIDVSAYLRRTRAKSIGPVASEADDDSIYLSWLSCRSTMDIERRKMRISFYKEPSPHFRAGFGQRFSFIRHISYILFKDATRLYIHQQRFLLIDEMPQRWSLDGRCLPRALMKFHRAERRDALSFHYFRWCLIFQEAIWILHIHFILKCTKVSMRIFIIFGQFIIYKMILTPIPLLTAT